jgi:hypothetical protein
MKWLKSGIVWGVLLILAGVLFLLNALNVIQISDYLWAILFLFAGIVFLTVFIENRKNWWAIIPGFVLIGVGLVALFNLLIPEFPESLGGGIVLGSLSIAFILIYLFNRESWWTIIPAGVLGTLAIAITIEPWLSDLQFVSLFFLGLGLTFAILGLIPNPEGKMGWAFIPAIVLAVIGAIFLFVGGSIEYLWPVALIVGGLFILIRAFRWFR